MWNKIQASQTQIQNPIKALARKRRSLSDADENCRVGLELHNKIQTYKNRSNSSSEPNGDVAPLRKKQNITSQKNSSIHESASQTARKQDIY